MRIRTQFWLAGAAAVAIGLTIVAALVQVTREAAAATQAQADAHEVARDVAGLLTLTLDYAMFGGQRPTEQWRARHGQLVATVDAAVRRSAPPEPTLVALQRSIEPLPALLDRLEGVEGSDDAELTARRRQFLVERLMTEIQEVSEARDRWAAAISAEQAREQQVYAVLVLGAPALLVLLLLALQSVVGVRVLGPLTRLQQAADALRRGETGVRAAEPGRADEIGDLARAFDAMTVAVQLQGDARRASEQHLRRVIDSVPGLIGYIDTDRRYALANRAYVAWHGLGLDAIVGADVAALYGVDDYPRFAPYLERALAGEPVAFEVDVTRHGRAWSMRMSYVPHIDDGGRTVGVYVMGTDLTELKRSERRLRTMMDASPLGIVLVDRDGLCRYANPAWQRILGLAAPPLVGERWDALLHPDDLDRVRAEWAALSDRPGDTALIEHRCRGADGRDVWVRMHVAAVGDGAGGRVATVEDITERRALDAELAARTEDLARSNAELEQFAYVASHDLQEPLRMVTSYTQLLRRRCADRLDADGQEFLGYIDDGGRRAQTLIADLLSLARVASQARPFEPVALDALLGEVLQGLALLIDEAGAVVTHDALPVVHADRRQIGQLLQNLLTNALKFRGSAPPRVHLGARREPDGRWRIDVSDNGIGIEPKFHARVFVLFQRLHLRNEYPGTGIGLAICKKVVERHGGRIGVESAPGRGACFWFTLADAGAAADRPALAA